MHWHRNIQAVPNSIKIVLVFLDIAAIIDMDGHQPRVEKYFDELKNKGG